MISTIFQVTGVVSLVFSSIATAKTLGRNQSSIVPIGGHGVVKVPVHRKPTVAGDPGAEKRQVDVGLLNPLYGLAYYVNS
jgi:hypothetical protein